jgi:hypothetical protein
MVWIAINNHDYGFACAHHESELFPQIGFVVTNSRISVEKVIKLYHRRAEIENRIKEGKNTLR